MATVKLFPPQLDPKLPAFAGDELKIIFAMNRVVGARDAQGARIIIKTVSTGKVLGTAEAVWGANGGPSSDLATGKCSIIFNVGSLNLAEGQYYKIQMAYLDDNKQEGYYSSSSIIKKISTPVLSILNVEKKTLNNYNYTGKYSQQGGDESEKVYSYRFDLYDNQGELVKTSGLQLHNNSQDSTYESTDTWRSGYDLIKNVPYYLTYTITTINGYTCSYRTTIQSVSSVDIDADIALESKLNYEDGSIILYLRPKNEKTSMITGDFILLRSSKSENFSSWDEVYRFSYKNIELTKDKPEPIWEDIFISQGEIYRYAIQAYNEYDFYSNRIYTINGDIAADFEHCFLTDADRQLKIAFNPQVSNFKNTIQESKIETMGSKYPFIFRNGNVKYKEFSISGLLSLISDENGKFIKKTEKEKEAEKQINQARRSATPGAITEAQGKTDLTSDNIYKERLFKMEVLEWLNNGKPKVFRSPTEGNFIVQLMNVSLTPNETLGRMLHNFTCTAYEVNEFSFANLLDSNMVQIMNPKTPTLRIGQVDAGSIYINKNTGKAYSKKIIQQNLENNYPWCSFVDTETLATLRLPSCYSVNITEATPGTRFKIWFSNDSKVIIEIGGTGAYYVPVAKSPKKVDDLSVVAIGIQGSLSDWGSTKITFEYYDNKADSTFSNIVDIVSDYEIRRFVGPGIQHNLVKPSNDSSISKYILSDIRREVGECLFFRVEKRHVEEVWKIDDSTYARNALKTDIIADDEWNPLTIYHYVDSQGRDKYLNGHYSLTLTSAPDFNFCLNDDKVYLGGTGIDPEPQNKESKYSGTFGRIELTHGIDNIHTLKIGTGVLLDIAYQVRIKEYGVETQSSISKLKNKWKAECDKLTALLQTKNTTQNDLDRANENISIAYENYLIALKNALDKELEK